MTRKNPLTVLVYVSFLAIGTLFFAAAAYIFATSIRPHQETVQDTGSAKQGTLWHDEENARYLITLGRYDGIKAGDIFKITDNGTTIGRAKVTGISAKTSVIDIVELKDNVLEKKYYKVISEQPNK